MDDAAQVRRIVGYWRQVELLGGTVPDPRPLDPVRHCQDLLGGTLTINVDSLLEVNGFRTEEHWTLVYQPRLRRDDLHRWRGAGSRCVARRECDCGFLIRFASRTGFFGIAS